MRASAGICSGTSITPPGTASRPSAPARAPISRFHRPSSAFGTDKDWNYLAEDKIHKIITTQHIKNYNVANLAYDTLASVQKYLLIKDHININFDNYSSNQYLFVVNKDNNYLKNPAYEVNTYTPSQLVSSWKINKSYNLYLLKKL
jgi:hypothetical protein